MFFDIFLCLCCIVKYSVHNHFNIKIALVLDIKGENEKKSKEHHIYFLLNFYKVLGFVLR